MSEWIYDNTKNKVIRKSDNLIVSLDEKFFNTHCQLLRSIFDNLNPLTLDSLLQYTTKDNVVYKLGSFNYTTYKDILTPVDVLLLLLDGLDFKVKSGKIQSVNEWLKQFGDNVNEQSKMLKELFNSGKTTFGGFDDKKKNLEEQIEKLKEEKEKLEKELETCQSSKTTCDTNLENVKKEKESIIKTLNNELFGKQEKISQLTNEIKKCEELYGELQKKHEDVLKLIESQGQEIDKLQKFHIEDTSEIKTMLDNIRAQRVIINRIKRRINECSKNKEELEQKLKKETDDFSNFKQQIFTIIFGSGSTEPIDPNVIIQNLQTLKKEKEDCVETIKQLQEQITSIKTSFGITVDEHVGENVVQQKKKLDEKIEQLEIELERCNTEKKLYEEQNKKLQEEINKLTNDIKEKESLILTLLDKQREYKERITKLQQHIDKIKEKLAFQERQKNPLIEKKESSSITVDPRLLGLTVKNQELIKQLKHMTKELKRHQDELNECKRQLQIEKG